MKVNAYRSYKLQNETTDAAAKIPRGCVDEQSHKIGLDNGEPIIYALDGLTRYAKAYRQRFESNLADDHCLGEHWLDAAKAIRGLLNGDGAVAMERGITTDSKSNGACEDMFWAAMAAAGFEGKDL